MPVLYTREKHEPIRELWNLKRRWAVAARIN